MNIYEYLADKIKNKDKDENFKNCSDNDFPENKIDHDILDKKNK